MTLKALTHTPHNAYEEPLSAILSLKPQRSRSDEAPRRAARRSRRFATRQPPAPHRSAAPPRA
eukprot:7381684-Prymnesium_polylepis.1